MVSVLFEDEYVVAVNKPSGVLTIKDRLGIEKNLYDTLKINYPELYLIHRIDRETSGLLLFAKTKESQKRFSSLFENHNIVKIYHAIVQGRPNIDEGVIENYIQENPQKPGSYRVGNQKGKLAISFFKCLESYKRHSLVGFDIRTGRTHQIRVHASHIGVPLAYDPLYNLNSGIFVSMLKPKFKSKIDQEERSIIQRLSLHAFSIHLIHPFTENELYVEAPYPNDFSKAVEILRKYS